MTHYRNYDAAHTILQFLTVAGWIGAAVGIVGAGIAMSQAGYAIAIYGAMSALVCVGLVVLSHVGRAVLHLSEDVNAALTLMREDRQSRR